ncbi:acid protease [Pyrenochaeta sp. DS3sAY3a]|nr:acid protease [Pyrenochaeta sp. DS3sAY3a]
MGIKLLHANVAHGFYIACIFIGSIAVITILYSLDNFHPLSRSNLNLHNGVVELDVYIDPGRKDDRFMNVDLAIDGNVLPLYIDTSFADTFVATDRCDTLNVQSGCFNLSSSYHINEATGYLPHEPFDTHLGEGQVLGNLSAVSLNFGSFVMHNATIALIDWATEKEFHNGSFVGVLGLGLRRVSQTWNQYHRLPVLDTMIQQKILKRPVLSLSFPRFGDPKQEKGKMVLGDVESIPGTSPPAYCSVIGFSRSTKLKDHATFQGWSVALEGLRMNGVSIALSPGRFRTDRQHVAVLDSGAPNVYIPTPEFNAVIDAFHGSTATELNEAGTKLFFECEKAQLLELKICEQWVAVDPLDILKPQSQDVVNGTRMCQTGIRSNFTDFGDTILGMPFLRSMLTVFDYVDSDMYRVSRRIGLASRVDTSQAMMRYKRFYQNRLH